MTGAWDLSTGHEFVVFLNKLSLRISFNNVTIPNKSASNFIHSVCNLVKREMAKGRYLFANFL